MEFTGPYRDLLRRIYERSLAQGWFGPEDFPPFNRRTGQIRDYILWGHVSEEDMRLWVPFVDPLEYEYTVRDRRLVTIIRAHHDMQLHRFGYPPATPEQVKRTERAIGFALLPLLYALYTQLANGGFGFFSGFVGIADGFDDSDWVRSIDHETSHSSWKLTDQVPNGLVGQREALLSQDLPDRFMPWCSLGCGGRLWIDGWSGHMYETWPGDCDNYQPSAPGPRTEDYACWEESDRADAEWVEVDVNQVREAECYAITYLSPSLEAWLEDWLATPLLPDYVSMSHKTFEV